MFIKPTTIATQGDITVDYVRQPVDPIWGFDVGTLGQYVYNSTLYNVNTSPNGSRDFEQTNVILQILKYAGIIIEDPLIVENAAQQVAINEQNEKI